MVKKEDGTEMVLTWHGGLQYMPSSNDDPRDFSIYLDYTHYGESGKRHRFYLSQLLFDYWTTTRGKSLQIYGPNGDGTGWSTEQMTNFPTHARTTIQNNGVDVSYVLVEYMDNATTDAKKYKIGFI
jgi:hypothetical protein